LRLDGVKPVVAAVYRPGRPCADRQRLFFISVFFGTRSRLVVGWRKLMG
jgi:hypothetical protein